MGGKTGDLQKPFGYYNWLIYEMNYFLWVVTHVQATATCGDAEDVL